MSFPFMNCTGRLTEEQQQLVTDHIQTADQAANWLAPHYRQAGWSPDDALCDAYAWLVYSALRYNPTHKTAAAFSTYYLGNIKWWRSDVRTAKPAEVRKWRRTASLQRLAAMSEVGDERIDNIAVMAICDPEPHDPDEPDIRKEITDALLNQIRYGQYLLDIAAGATLKDIQQKYGIRTRSGTRHRVSQARKKAKVLLRRFLSGRDSA